ncbi:hypothetical protein [Sporosarcina sp. HYO08]|uniref:hypothetical protein n=1 Tax=Sporosarcina sp. HYO08 TaxID=1759557 RepID=UPI000791B1F5|nr:hypothetical protein [Sporosarcina sp. HYO08]KXH87368.1 hypothetical protein AU377_02000 [Sporosarcina sp. HYO08]
MKMYCRDCEQEAEFYPYWKTRCKECQRAKQRAFNRANPDYLKAKNQRRRARLLALPNDLPPQVWTDIQERFGGRCALTDSTDISLEHVIPLENMHLGTTIENVIPLDRTLNMRKSSKNFIDWVFEPEIEALIDEDKLNDLLCYLAEVNGLSVDDYLDFIYWCERNKRTEEEVKSATKTSVELFKESQIKMNV